MSIQVSDLLFIYAVASAITHTFKAGRWLWRKGDDERRNYIAAHVRDQHGERLKFCRLDKCINLSAR